MRLVKTGAGPKGFHAIKLEFVNLRKELENLPQAEKRDIDKLHASAHERQKQIFLSKFFIDDANIPRIGPARKAALRSFGIETAADVTKSRVMQVGGFGESLTHTVLDWKASCERRFKFNPSAAISEADRNPIGAKYRAKRVQLEGTLSIAPEQLKQFRKNAALKLASLRPQLESAARKLAQAQADLALF